MCLERRLITTIIVLYQQVVVCNDKIYYTCKRKIQIRILKTILLKGIATNLKYRKTDINKRGLA